jgi:hypothetical protein
VMNMKRMSLKTLSLSRKMLNLLNNHLKLNLNL